MVDARVGRQVKGKARESPVRFLKPPSIRNATEAGRSHPRGSQRVLELYSPSILKLVR
jgi:hypothetical protein